MPADSTEPPAPGGQARPLTAVAALDAAALRRAFAGAAASIAASADALNAINVFPVPDGDTGTNMRLTLEAVAGAVHAAAPDATPATIVRAAADAALIAARGNSGVILSQLLAGLVHGIDANAAALDAAALARALAAGADTAYRAVLKPREGTILTAAREAARGAEVAAAAGATAEATLAAAADSAHEAARRSPELLPVLRETGVVDAGAQGLALLLDGMLAGIRHETPPPAHDFGHIDAAWLAARDAAHAAAAGEYRFCTEFVLAPPGGATAPDAAALRERFAAFGDSLLVVEGDGFARVHVHTAEPDAVFAAARSFGRVSHEKADDMAAQFARLRAASSPPASPPTLGIVAVAAGAGLERLFRSLGAHEVVHGGQTMNPSAGEMAAAAERTGAPEVAVLPDNKNVVLAAEQAARMLAGRVRLHVVPATSVPQGIAALVALNPEAAPANNVAAMTQALAGVRTAEVTHAARAARIAGRDVPARTPIGIVEGELRVAEATVADAVLACARELARDASVSLITLYAGEDADAATTDAIAARLRDELAVEVEVVDGGQPHYPYLIGAEA